MSGAGAHFGRLQLPAHDQAPANSLIDCLDLQLRRDRAINNDVDERSQRRGNSNAVDGFYITLAESGTMQAEHLGNCGHPLEPWRDCHVQFRRHRVGQFMKRECSRVAEGSLRLTAAVV